ncbi:MAG: rhomboid family intramembrane serine protease [Pseudobdellovibrionaceae bacterium]
METRIIKTWLSKKPSSDAGVVAWFSTLLLVVGSVIYWQNLFGWAEWMAASKKAVFENHEYWRAWTSLIIHGDGKHLLANSFLFFILGYFLSGFFGSLLFPLLTFAVGGITNLFVLAQMPLETELVGASGIVFWMGGAWLILYFFLDRVRSLGQRTLRALGVGVMLFMPAEAFDPQVSYKAHFIGFILGIVSGLVYYLIKRREFLAAEVREVVIEESEEAYVDPLQL